MRSVQTKISIVIAVITILTTGSLVMTALIRSRQFLDQDSDKLLETTADYYRIYLDDLIKIVDPSGDDTAATLSLLREEAPGISVSGIGSAILLDKNGNVLYAKDYPDGAVLTDLPDEKRELFDRISGLDREGVNKRIVMDRGPSKVAVRELRNRMLLVIYIPRTEIAPPQVRLAGQLLVTSLIILAVVIITGILVVRSIVGPLKKMTDVADRYADGDYSEKIMTDSDDEVGRLSRSLQTMSATLVRQIEIADEANEAKTSFLSNMSHEIRTPITAILGFNEMILRESDDRDILQYAQNIQNSGHTLLGIINDILDLSRIEAGKIEIIPADYDVSSMLNDLINMVRIRAAEKSLHLVIDIDKNIPRMLNGDEVRIKQIMTNILTNAVKYTEKGSITVTVGYQKDEDIPGTVLINVAVKDTGIGIREEDMNRLFAKFERIDTRRNRHIEGTGLGMSITKSLLEMMGSSLKVESTYGEGSVFSFSIKQNVVKWDPIGDHWAYAERLEDEKKRHRSSFTAGDALVLIVDDNSMNLLLFKSLMKQTLVKVDTADSGDECLRMCRSTKYDMIFLDHMMPGKDGIQTLHELKEMSDSPNIDTPVISLTANAVSGAREEYIREGFTDYLTKPIDYKKLDGMLTGYLPKDKITMRSAAPDTEDISSLKVFDGQDLIDTKAGMYYCGSEKAYLEILSSYYSSISENADKLSEFLMTGDLYNYTVLIHSVKSTSRTIGATGLSDMAKELEHAGNEGDIDKVRKDHEAFMVQYMKVKRILKKALS